MEQAAIISITTYCHSASVEPVFVQLLADYGLIRIDQRPDGAYIHEEELVLLEKYSRFYYDLEINVPGIDALEDVLEKMRSLQKELVAVKERLRIYETY